MALSCQVLEITGSNTGMQAQGSWGQLTWPGWNELALRYVTQQTVLPPGHADDDKAGKGAHY